MKRFVISAALVCATLAACAQSYPAPEAVKNAELIDYRTVSALGKGRTAELRAFLADTSFLVAMMGGRHEVYFGKNGAARIKDTRKGTVENGQWQVIDIRFASDLICWTPGAFPAEMAGKSLVDLCSTVGEFVGRAFYLSRGDTFGLSNS